MSERTDILAQDAEVSLEIERTEGWLYRWAATVVVQQPNKIPIRTNVGVGFTRDGAITEAKRRWKRRREWETESRKPRVILERIQL